MLVCCLAYLAWLSRVAFLITVGSIAFGIYVFIYYARTVQGELRTAAHLEAGLLGSLSHILFGFKELRFNTVKSDRLFRRLTETAVATRDTKTRIGLMFVFQMMFSQVFFYLLLAVVVFVMPNYEPTYGTTVIVKITSTILFIIGPINFVVSSLPTISRIDVALDNLYELERTLDRPGTRTAEAAAPDRRTFADFRRIEMDRVMFSYVDDEGEPLFTVGPLGLRVNRGKVIFFVGGNGSGKSTIIKLLTGLYSPDAGRITVDGRKPEPANLQDYRELFSTIFTDFHLFDRLYGLEAVPVERVEGLIREMELEDKVTYDDGRFSTLNLSTGQRKRLALIVALLEDREIYVFDEWAADQDQHFRKHFYEDILMDLKARGKTVIAVTHDEQYWRVADHLVKLELGQIVSDETLH
jgi:putative ATP-binding cassette transporter